MSIMEKTTRISESDIKQAVIEWLQKKDSVEYENLAQVDLNFFDQEDQDTILQLNLEIQIYNSTPL